MGMSAPEWSRYMHDVIGLTESPAEIDELVVERLLERYAEQPPVDRRSGRRRAEARTESFRLALASSSNRRVIDAVLDAAGLASAFEATVSSEEVDRGKPAPDVFLEAASRLDLPPGHCAAVEDSGNGIRAAHAAGMRVVAIPEPALPPTRGCSGTRRRRSRGDRRAHRGSGGRGVDPLASSRALFVPTSSHSSESR